MRKKEYTLYKGDEIIDFGIAEEIAKRQNVKKETILYYGTPAHLRRMKKSRFKNYKVLVKS